jgi:nucleoside 2-deoxyribosyltransferase
MTMRPKLYLAGPEVFLAEAREIGRRKTDRCADYGFEGLYPFDADVIAAGGEAPDRQIYRANVAMLHAADAGIFNLTPFRGPSADAGTLFELGLMSGLGKPCFAYTNDPRTLLERMQQSDDGLRDAATGLWADRLGRTIENFGNSDNLMIDVALAEQGADFFIRPAGDAILPLDDLSGFSECLTRACRYFGLRDDTQAKRRT